MMDNNLACRVDFIKSKLLSSYSVKAKNLWIEDCVKFFISQAPNIDNETLYQQAFEQFLLADVTEAGNPVIPGTIQQRKEVFTLNGTFVLQLQFIIDVSESPYEQWRRLHNIRLDEVEEIRESKTFQTKKKRMFKLELTDGYKTVHAMEYEKILTLTSKLPPGSKLQIIGPFQVVNHLLLLGPQNLKLLGGDVESLLIINAYENVLLRALNKPTTNTPITDYNDEVVTTDTRVTNNPVRTTNGVATRQVEENLLEGINFDEEDDIDMEMLMRIEQDAQRNRPNVGNVSEVIVNGNVNQNFTQRDEFNDDDDALAMEIDMIEAEAKSNAAKPVEVVEIPDYVPPPRIIRGNDLLPTINIPDTVDFHYEPPQRASNSINYSHDSVDLTLEPVPWKIARVEPTKFVSISDDAYKFKSNSGDHLVTIDQYLSLKVVEKTKRDYVLCVRVESVVNKSLHISSNQWRLSAVLEDSYSFHLLTVEFQGKVLERLTGTTIPEMQLMYQEASSRPQIRDDIFRILKNLKEKIVALDGFVKIQMNCAPPLKQSYEVVEIFDDNPENQRNYSLKIKEENLVEVEGS